MSILNNTNFAQYAILITALTYINAQLMPMWKSLWRLILRKLTYKVTIEETDELYQYFEKWLYKNYASHYRNLEATIQKKVIYYERENINENINNDKLYTYQHEDFFIIYAGTPKRRLVITKGREKLDAAKTLKESYFNRFSIKGFGAKQTILNILNDVIEYNQQFKRTWQSKVNINDSHGYWNTIGSLEGKNINNIILNNKQEIIDDFQEFIDTKLWYNDRNIPYKRGYIFEGRPGNGKTALCQTLALHFKKHIYYLSLNTIAGDQYLINAFSNIRPGSILVIEDVDACYTGRKAKDVKVSYSTLLNCLDGGYSNNNIITIMTTNHIEKLDPALIRCGRIDKKINIDNPNKNMVEEYINNFFECKIILKNYKDFKLPMVDIQNICLINKKDLNKVIEIIDVC